MISKYHYFEYNLFKKRMFSEIDIAEETTESKIKLDNSWIIMIFRYHAVFIKSLAKY